MLTITGGRLLLTGRGTPAPWSQRPANPFAASVSPWNRASWIVSRFFTGKSAMKPCRDAFSLICVVTHSSSNVTSVSSSCV